MMTRGVTVLVCMIFTLWKPSFRSIWTCGGISRPRLRACRHDSWTSAPGEIGISRGAVDGDQHEMKLEAQTM